MATEVRDIVYPLWKRFAWLVGGVVLVMSFGTINPLLALAVLAVVGLVIKRSYDSSVRFAEQHLASQRLRAGSDHLSAQPDPGRGDDRPGGEGGPGGRADDAAD